MSYNITLIPGDGIGPEVSSAARLCVDAVAAKHSVAIEWDMQKAGEDAIKEFGQPLPEQTIESIKKNGIVLKGPITTPVGKGFRSVNVGIRQAFDLYANLRPVRTYPGVSSRYSDVDLVVVRENIEDLYAGIEFGAGKEGTLELIALAKKETGKDIRPDSAISLKPISGFRSERIAKFAFEYAKKNNRKKVTAVHKANIMKFTDGLFLDSVRKIAAEYSSIAFEDRIVDNLSMQLVTNPTQFDVLVCPNLYGDIISDLCSGLAGGLGVAPSASIGEKYAMFEPVHGSAPKHAGKNEVNPSACILSGAMMLKHIGEPEAAADLESAVLAVIKEGRQVTYDLKPTVPVGTREMANAIIAKLKS
jgi:isocitrate dehydrogenase (NAD+)